MKHSFKITLVLVTIFFISQIIGLGIIDRYIDHETTTPEARAQGNITWDALPLDIERPEIEESFSFVYILVTILIGTGLVLLIIKLGKHTLWKLWFLFAVVITLTFAFGAYINQWAAFILALLLATYKIFRPNIIIHNLTEIFIYGGLASILVPIMNIFAAVALLILISIYDFWAVFKSKHMVKLAKFQTKSKVFAGLLIPYQMPKKVPKGKNVKTIKVKNAVLGGGDIGFPLIFAGVVMKTTSFLKVIPIPIFATLALLYLLTTAKEDKFYPAMPIITIGCFIGYGITLLI
ncbi:presenilin family intramembrane aspartyl protease [Nanoarchaeota archaeon]